MERIVDLPRQITAAEVVAIAKAYKAELTPSRQILWIHTIGKQNWEEKIQYRPSVLDAVILDRARKVGPSYLQAAQAATGWHRRTILGFLQIMLCGEPLEPSTMLRFNYWKGIIIGLLVHAKLRRY